MTTPLLDRLTDAERHIIDTITRAGHGLDAVKHEVREQFAELRDATRPQPGIPPEGEFVLVPRPVVEFLNGAAPLEGCWFGSDRRPKFWWRRHLTSHAVAQCAPQGEAVPAWAWRQAYAEANEHQQQFAGPSTVPMPSFDVIEARARELAGQGRET